MAPRTHRYALLALIGGLFLLCLVPQRTPASPNVPTVSPAQHFQPTAEQGRRATPLCPTGDYMAPAVRAHREAVLREHIKMLDPQSPILGDTDRPPHGRDWWVYEDAAWPKPAFCGGVRDGQDPEWAPDAAAGIRHPGCSAQYILTRGRAIVQMAWKCGTTAGKGWAECVSGTWFSRQEPSNDGCAATVHSAAPFRQALVTRQPLSRMVSAYHEIYDWNRYSWFLGEYDDVLPRARETEAQSLFRWFRTPDWTGCAWPMNWTWRHDAQVRPANQPQWPDARARPCMWPCWCGGFADAHGRPQNVSTEDAVRCGSSGWIWSGLKLLPEGTGPQVRAEAASNGAARRDFSYCHRDNGFADKPAASARAEWARLAGARRIVDEEERFRGFVHATACVRAYHAAPHAWSVSFFARSLRDASGSVPRISQLLRVETLRDDMQRFVANTSLDVPRCTSLLRSDRRQEKKAKRILPASRVLHRMLRSEPALAHMACRIYAQDFVCFGYELPAACLSLFPLEPDQGQPTSTRKEGPT